MAVGRLTLDINPAAVFAATAGNGFASSETLDRPCGGTRNNPVGNAVRGDQGATGPGATMSTLEGGSQYDVVL